MTPRRIRLFIKPGCPWCHQAMAWLDQRGLRYEVLDVIRDRSAWAEMLRLSGQTRAPVLELDGQVLADFGVPELERFWNRRVGQPSGGTAAEMPPERV